MLKLRTYQEAAIAAAYTHLRASKDNPCIVIPTAGGKTPIMASICKDAVGRCQNDEFTRRSSYSDPLIARYFPRHPRVLRTLSGEKGRSERRT